MQDRLEDLPTGEMAQKIVQQLTVAMMVSEAAAQLAARAAANRAARDERERAALHAQHRARYAQDRLRWEKILDPKQRADALVPDTAWAWTSARAWPGDQLAEKVAALAEDRLRELRPDVMEHYDTLRAEGVEPVPAMRNVAHMFEHPRVHTGSPGPTRAHLPMSDASADAPATAAEPRQDREGHTAWDFAAANMPLGMEDMTVGEVQELAAVMTHLATDEQATTIAARTVAAQGAS